MNAYEQRQEERRQRYLDLAAKKAAAGEGALSRARQMSDAIPFGQPIIVGHHSESRDRNFRKRMNNTYDRGFAELDKAKHYEQKAASVGTGGISSDDPDAVEKLREKLAAAEARQEMMKAANAIIRKKKLTDDEKVSGMVALGMSEGAAREALKPDFCGRIGFPAYELQNNSGNMQRIKERIQTLEARATRTAREPITGNGFTIREDADENRVMIEFDAIPAPEVRQQLKRSGFKWSPTRGAWVRMLSRQAWYMACYALGVEPQAKQEAAPMVANVYSNGKHTRLKIEAGDIEELVARCGWMVLDDIENMTEEAREVVKALEAKGSAESPGRDTLSAIQWWKDRTLSAEPCLTPDM